MKLTATFLRHLKKPTPVKAPPVVVVIAEIQDDDSDSVKFVTSDEGDESTFTLMSFRETTTEQREIRAIRQDRTRFLALRLDMIKALAGASKPLSDAESAEYKALVLKLGRLKRIIPATYAQASPVIVAPNLTEKESFVFSEAEG